MRELTGRVAVVTGAGSGIGYALAERFALEGMRLVIADIERGALHSAETQLRSTGAEILAVETDVANPDSVRNLAAKTLGTFGAAHVVCNNAGVAAQGTVWETSLADWDWVLGVNLWGVIHGIRTFVPILLEQDEAHVVNTASIAGIVAGAVGTYSVAKHAVVALSEALYFGLQQRADAHIGVSVLCPGFVRTRIYDAQRNRPLGAGQPSRVSDAELAERELVKAGLEAGKDPAEVADQVVDAIRTGRFYVLTHPEHLDAVRGRTHDIEFGLPPRRIML